MRILSKKQDYYDFAGYWQSDILYIRKMENVDYVIDQKVKDQMRNIGESTSRFNDIYRYYLLICGTIYIRYYDSKLNKWVDFVNEKERKRRQSKWYAKYTDTSTPSKKDIVKIHKDLNAPIIGVDTRYCADLGCITPHYRHTHIVRNPILVDHDFTEIQADILHREIEFFISNDLRVESAMPEFSDIEKVQQHGFDKKLSFRKTK